MAATIRKWEQRARYAMGGAACIGVLGLMAFKLGWISTMPSYKDQSWYLVGERAGVIIASEYEDEASCRRNEQPSKVCRSGKSLMDEARIEHLRRS